MATYIAFVASCRAVTMQQTLKKIKKPYIEREKPLQICQKKVGKAERRDEKWFLTIYMHAVGW
jgi:hypothetical protein